MNNLMVKKAFVNPLYNLDAHRDVETIDSSESEDDNSEISNNSNDSDYLCIHARMNRQRDSHQSVR